MTITVEAGIRMDDLRKALEEENLRLPIDVAQSGRATLGGAIAANASGPARFGHGTFRDYLIGISAIDGQGRLFSAGGRVVKNVAGYDLCKLLIGSLGTLAVITSVTLKLRPLAPRRGILMASSGSIEVVASALNTLSKSATRPIACELLNPKATWQIQGETKLSLPDQKNTLWIIYEGTDREVDWQTATIESELKSLRFDEIRTDFDDQLDKIYSALVEFQTASDDPLSFRASMPASRTHELLQICSDQGIAAQAHAGNGIVIGHLPDRCTDASSASEILLPLRNFAEQNDGALTVTSCDPEWKNEIDPFGTRPPSWKIMAGLKQTLDPDSLLSPNRFGF